MDDTQICYITKEEVSSPTIYLEDLLTRLIIDAHKEIDVVIFDVLGAYFSTGTP